MEGFTLIRVDSFFDMIMIAPIIGQMKEIVFFPHSRMFVCKLELIDFEGNQRTAAT